MEEHSDFRCWLSLSHISLVAHCSVSTFSSPDEDYRLFILIVVSSFIILSLILIIGITSCILICFEDSMSDVNTQYKQIQQVDISGL